MIKKLIPIFIFLIALASVNPWSKIPLGNTFIWWTIGIATLVLFIKAKPKYYNLVNEPNILLVKLYLFWNIICIIRGGIIAENYWEAKNLITMGLVLLLPLTIYISTNRKLVQLILNQYIRYILPAFFVFAIFISSAAYGSYLIPVSFVLLFLPLLPKKWKGVMLFFTLIVLTLSITSRSSVIKFLVPLLLSILYYFRGYIGKRKLGIVGLLLLVTPIVFFFLAITGQFNPFKMDEYITGDYTANQDSGEVENLKADTRTGLYVEVLLSAIKNDYIWFGRTPARGNDSILFGKEIEAQTNTGKLERYANEVSILNIFTWTGLVGVILYFLVFIRASFLAVYKSRSWFMKIMGVYVCFRWLYAWVEDFSRFDFSYILLWIIIGMCFSESFRQMTNTEFKYWIRGIFDIRYRKATLSKVRVIEQA